MHRHRSSPSSSGQHIGSVHGRESAASFFDHYYDLHRSTWARPSVLVKSEQIVSSLSSHGDTSQNKMNFSIKVPSLSVP